METGIVKRKAEDALQVIYGLVEVLKEYGVKEDNFCITGSYALTTLGLNLGRPLNDVDLYLNLDPEVPEYKGALKRLIAMQYASGYYMAYDDRTTIVLDFQGIRVNIFTVFNIGFGFRTIPTGGGYHIDTIDHVLSKKMALKRPKDHQDMNTIIKNLLSI